MKNKLIIMAGPNVIESENHCLSMAKKLKIIFSKYPDIDFYFKSSFDKANRTSFNSFRGVGIEKGIEIFKKIKQELKLKIITDIHEPWQASKIANYIDIIQIPAFLCRQTDLIKAAAETNKIIHVKKGQFMNASSMIKVVEKFRKFGHNNTIILCERGNNFGYQDLIVDTRNLVWLKGNDNLVSMDITHCLQQPGQVQEDGTVKSGGLREFIPLMARIAIVSDVDAIFMEVHNNPDKSLCDAPTQYNINNLDKFLKNISKLKSYISLDSET